MRPTRLPSLSQCFWVGLAIFVPYLLTIRESNDDKPNTTELRGLGYDYWTDKDGTINMVIPPTDEYKLSAYIVSIDDTYVLGTVDGKNTKYNVSINKDKLVKPTKEIDGIFIKHNDSLSLPLKKKRQLGNGDYVFITIVVLAGLIMYIDAQVTAFKPTNPN
jgi:hypothetical protein